MPEIKPVSLGGVMVGDEYPTVFMAEIGTFFNKDIGLAKSYLEAVVAAGAPILKTEVLHDPDVCLKDSGLLHRYNHAGGTKVEVHRELIERKCVPLDGYRVLFEECKRLGIPFVASVYDPVGVDFLVDVGVAGFKIARDSINNLPLIRQVARTGLPVIFDAGFVYLYEVARAVEWARAEGASGIIVNHHPGANPAPPEIHHFRTIRTYADALRVPVGLACHYRGDDMLLVAVGAGANLLEKGVVDDPDRVEQDLVSASRLSELPALIRRVADASDAMGRATVPIQEPRDLTMRKGIAVQRDIDEGEVLGAENIRYAWPQMGISVEHWDSVVGSRARRPLRAGDPVSWDDIRVGDGDPTRWRL